MMVFDGGYAPSQCLMTERSPTEGNIERRRRLGRPGGECTPDGRRSQARSTVRRWTPTPIHLAIPDPPPSKGINWWRRAHAAEECAVRGGGGAWPVRGLTYPQKSQSAAAPATAASSMYGARWRPAMGSVSDARPNSDLICQGMAAKPSTRPNAALSMPTSSRRGPGGCPLCKTATQGRHNSGREDAVCASGTPNETHVMDRAMGAFRQCLWHRERRRSGGGSDVGRARDTQHNSKRGQRRSSLGRRWGHRTLARAWRRHGAGVAQAIGNYWLGWHGRGTDLSCDPWDVAAPFPLQPFASHRISGTHFFIQGAVEIPGRVTPPSRNVTRWGWGVPPPRAPASSPAGLWSPSTAPGAFEARAAARDLPTGSAESPGGRFRRLRPAGINGSPGVGASSKSDLSKEVLQHARTKELRREVGPPPRQLRDGRVDDHVGDGEVQVDAEEEHGGDAVRYRGRRQRGGRAG
eukprot:gene2529-biopygen5027